MNIVLKLIRKFQTDQVSETGAQLTYFLILSIFPFLIALLHILQFTPLADGETLRKLLVALPTASQKVIVNLVEEVVGTSHTTLFSISILTALWSSSSGMLALIKSVNRAYDLKETRSYITLRLLSLVMTIGLILMIVVSLSLTNIEKYLFQLKLLQQLENHSFLIKMIHLIFVVILLTLILSFLYYIAPARKRLRFAYSVPGAFFATMGMLLSSLIFSVYVNNFANYSKVYGSLGGVIILLVWLYMISMIVILGAELNSILIEDKEWENV